MGAALHSKAGMVVNFPGWLCSSAAARTYLPAPDRGLRSRVEGRVLGRLAAVVLDHVLEEPLLALVDGLESAELLELRVVVARRALVHRGVHLADVLGMVGDRRPVERRAEADLRSRRPRPPRLWRSGRRRTASAARRRCRRRANRRCAGAARRSRRPSAGSRKDRRRHRGRRQPARRGSLRSPLPFPCVDCTLPRPVQPGDERYGPGLVDYGVSSLHHLSFARCGTDDGTSAPSPWSHGRQPTSAGHLLVRSLLAFIRELLPISSGTRSSSCRSSR